jgi:hypothetical protein
MTRIGCRMIMDIGGKRMTRVIGGVLDKMVIGILPKTQNMAGIEQNF